MLAVVTGGFGFLGSYVCEALSAAGWAFVVVDARRPEAINVAFVRSLPGYSGDHSGGDVADVSTLGAIHALYGPMVKAVFHLAAETHVDRSLGLDPTTLAPLAADPVERLYRTNVIGTVRAAEFARSVGAQLVHWSTDEVYGDCSEHPEGLKRGHICEPWLSKKSERAALQPSSPYAASKAAAEMAVSASVRLGLRATILRPSNAYGPRQARDKLIPVACAHLAAWRPVPLYGGGYQVRQWVHAADIARAALKAVDLQWEGTVNLGGPSLLRNADLVDLLARSGGVLPLPADAAGLIATVHDRPGHDVAYAVSSRRAERDLGWKPSRSIEQDAAEVFRAYAG
jgi:dTDP-glucose 4,6-dehydratase